MTWTSLCSLGFSPSIQKISIHSVWIHSAWAVVWYQGGDPQTLQCSEVGGGPAGKADSRSPHSEVLIQWTVCMVIRTQMIQIQVSPCHTRRNTKVGDSVFKRCSSLVSSYISSLITVNLDMISSCQISMWQTRYLQ